MKRTLHDLASLAARMGVGGIFFANGWQKLEAGLNATSDQFTELQAPLPNLWAAATMLTELVGGTLLIAGLAVPAVGLLLFVEALAVFVITAGDNGLPLTGGDIELIVALGAASVLLAVTGGGRISADHMVVIKRREAEAAGGFAADARTDAQAEADAEADAVIAALRPPRPGEMPGRSAQSTSAQSTPDQSATDQSAMDRNATDRDSAASRDGRPPGRSPGRPPGRPSDQTASSGASDPSGMASGSADDDTGEGRPGEKPPATPGRGAAPRQRRTKREDDTTTGSRAESPPAR